MIKDATFTSVWDGGVKISTNCKVNIDTKEVFDIEISDVCGVEDLDIEYVTIDGVDHPVSSDGSTEYWYD